MSRDREQRFQSAKELVDAFADAANIPRLPIPDIAPRSRMSSLQDIDPSHSVPPMTMSAHDLERRSAAKLTVKKQNRECMNSAHRTPSQAEVARGRFFQTSLARRSKLIAIFASMLASLAFVLVWKAMRTEAAPSGAVHAPAPLVAAPQITAAPLPIMSAKPAVSRPELLKEPSLEPSSKRVDITKTASPRRPKHKPKPSGKPTLRKESAPVPVATPGPPPIPDYGI
jgi:hypothetical protein